MRHIALNNPHPRSVPSYGNGEYDKVRLSFASLFAYDPELVEKGKCNHGQTPAKGKIEVKVTFDDGTILVAERDFEGYCGHEFAMGIPLHPTIVKHPPFVEEWPYNQK